MANKFNLGEQEHFDPFVMGEEIYDLSHLDSHIVEYVQPGPSGSDKKDITYKFYVTYSMHCFAKDYKGQCPIEASELMYRHARKESRPFCFIRYELSKRLPDLIRKLPDLFNFHAGHDNYATCTLENGDEYFISFAVFRERKKLRLHIMSAYPLDDPLGKRKKVKFFSIAHALLRNKKPPRPQK